jgi:hypothetical protein
VAKSGAENPTEADEALDYHDGWHWTTDAAHYNPDDIPK